MGATNTNCDIDSALSTAGQTTAVHVVSLGPTTLDTAEQRHAPTDCLKDKREAEQHKDACTQAAHQYMDYSACSRTSTRSTEAGRTNVAIDLNAQQCQRTDAGTTLPHTG